MEHEHYRYIIGNAVTRRVITLPEGRSLVVHIESTRALVRLIMACDKYHAHELVHFLDGLAIRPLSEIVLSTTSPLLHHELAQAMDILLRANGGSAQSFVAKCRNFVVNAAVALIVFGAKNIVSLYHNHTASELQTAELQRELECSRESCQIGVRFIDALLNVPNAATDILPYLLQQNGAGVLQVAARTHISEVTRIHPLAHLIKQLTNRLCVCVCRHCPCTSACVASLTSNLLPRPSCYPSNSCPRASPDSGSYRPSSRPRRRITTSQAGSLNCAAIVRFCDALSNTRTLYIPTSIDRYIRILLSLAQKLAAIT